MKPNVNETSLIWEHQSKIQAIEVDLKNIKSSSEDVAVIKNTLIYISKNIDEIKKGLEQVDSRATALETKQSSLETKIGLFAGVQAVFAVAVGAVSTFLNK